MPKTTKAPKYRVVADNKVLEGTAEEIGKIIGESQRSRLFTLTVNTDTIEDSTYTGTLFEIERELEEEASDYEDQIVGEAVDEDGTEYVITSEVRTQFLIEPKRKKAPKKK